jgi:hypothetical protein
MLCGTRQPVGGSCCSCGEVMAGYYCGICHLFDDELGRYIYHCPFCNVCRWADIVTRSCSNPFPHILAEGARLACICVGFTSALNCHSLPPCKLCYCLAC